MPTIRTPTHPKRAGGLCSLLAALCLLGGCDDTAAADAGPTDASPVVDARTAADSGQSDAGPPVDAGPHVVGDVALDTAVRGVMARSHLPGVSLALVTDGDVAWTGTWGLADVAEGVPVEPDTIFMVASVSKAVAGLCAMHAVENDVVDLDADVSAHVPWAVHPGASTPVTLRMLLTHSAGIRDDNDHIWGEYVYGSDATEPLGAYLRDYLDPAGADYDASHWAHEPGTVAEYSNIGIALAGYVVEAASGTSFAQYCESNIFTPMGLVDTHWFLADVDVDRTALPHQWDGSVLESTGHYGYPDYPDGQLRSTATELAQVLRLVLADGVLDGTRILAASSIEELQRRQTPSLDSTRALAWRWWDGSETYFGHLGADRGVSTGISYRERGEVGVVVLTNGRGELSDFEDIELAAYAYADRR